MRKPGYGLRQPDVRWPNQAVDQAEPVLGLFAGFPELPHVDAQAVGAAVEGQRLIRGLRDLRALCKEPGVQEARGGGWGITSSWRTAIAGSACRSQSWPDTVQRIS